ncbi:MULTISPECIES: response regulator [unclassified Pseudomonas]|uniref:response regulator n=1 Tax=unclassified Pseudomonas TaxID=196821 RepID=UPI0025F5B97E|nr:MULTISPECIES: response regulator [unclassified Pseudomonas]
MSTIILVEDEQDILTIMVEILEMEGHRVRAFSEADSAWSHIQHNGFDADLLVTDLRMPGRIDGLGLVQRMHDLLPQMPVVVASGFHAAVNTLDYDHVHWLNKPFTLTQLQAICQRLTAH